MAIYLDVASTTKPRQEVIDVMMPYFTEKWYNPSSLHSKANEVKKDIENARETIGNFINANGNEIFFTSGGSESNCWAIQGFINHCRRKGKTVSIITSTIEHKSILDCVDNMDVDVHYVPVNREGLVDFNAFETILRHASKEAHEVLVSIQFANNEIGTIQSIMDIARLAHRYDAVFHTDAVQAFGHIPINVRELDIDMMSVSGHKINAPKGIGFLYIKNGIEIDPLIYGSQMDGMRGGTENVPYIIGMAKAVELCEINAQKLIDLCNMRNYFAYRFVDKFGCKLNGYSNNILPNNINVTFPQNITGENLIYLLDMSGIIVSAGSACQSRSIESSHVLKAIGLSDEEANRTIRITIPDNISLSNIDKIICEIEKQITLLSIEEDN